MEEKKVDKYQESVEDIEMGTVPRGEGLSPREKQEVPLAEKKIEQVQKPELPKQVEPGKEAELKKDLSAEALKKTRAALEAEGPPSGGSSAVPTEDDKALCAKKIEEIKKLSQEEQIKALCDLAVEKDIDFAAETAKGLNDAYVLDEFHDKLDKLNLIKKGKLKEI